MQKWEYRAGPIFRLRWDILSDMNSAVVDQADDWVGLLNLFGARGWEMTGVSGDVFYFKRPLQEEK